MKRFKNALLVTLLLMVQLSVGWAQAPVDNTLDGQDSDNGVPAGFTARPGDVTNAQPDEGDMAFLQRNQGDNAAPAPLPNVLNCPDGKYVLDHVEGLSQFSPDYREWDNDISRHISRKRFMSPQTLSEVLGPQGVQKFVNNPLRAGVLEQYRAYLRIRGKKLLLRAGSMDLPVYGRCWFGRKFGWHLGQLDINEPVVFAKYPIVMWVYAKYNPDGSVDVRTVLGYLTSSIYGRCYNQLVAIGWRIEDTHLNNVECKRNIICPAPVRPIPPCPTPPNNPEHSNITINNAPVFNNTTGAGGGVVAQLPAFGGFMSTSSGNATVERSGPYPLLAGGFSYTNYRNNAPISVNTGGAQASGGTSTAYGGQGGSTSLSNGVSTSIGVSLSNGISTSINASPSFGNSNSVVAAGGGQGGTGNGGGGNVTPPANPPATSGPPSTPPNDPPHKSGPPVP
jgi:hypothetical protein